MSINRNICNVYDFTGSKILNDFVECIAPLTMGTIRYQQDLYYNTFNFSTKAKLCSPNKLYCYFTLLREDNHL